MMAAILFCVLMADQAQAAPGKTTEVVFVGTQHFLGDMPAGYGPGHLRALLAKINPAVLAVEAPTNVKNPWDFAPLELQRTTKPWADEHKVPLLPVGWNDVFYQAKIQTMVRALQKAGRGDDFQRLETRFQEEIAGRTSCEDMNGDLGADLWRNYHRALHELVGKDTAWETWNSKIVENLKATLKEHRGKRVAIVFGAAHGYFILDALSKEEGFSVLPCKSFLPLAAREIQANTTANDHLQALRLLNFGSVSPDKLEELGKHLEQIRGVERLQADYDLFSGKYLLHKGDAGAAAARFRKVADLPEDRISEFDGVTRLSEAGAIQEAIALARQAKSGEARERIESLLKKETLSLPMRQWAQQILSELGPPK